VSALVGRGRVGNLDVTPFRGYLFSRVPAPTGHFHDLRHTGNGNALTSEAGANLRELMARMGQSSTRAALIYLHSTDARQRAIADKIGKQARAVLRKSQGKTQRAAKTKPQTYGKRSGTRS
jgi:hypothetical protein